MTWSPENQIGSGGSRVGGQVGVPNCYKLMLPSRMSNFPHMINLFSNSADIIDHSCTLSKIARKKSQKKGKSKLY